MNRSSISPSAEDSGWTQCRTGPAGSGSQRVGVAVVLGRNADGRKAAGPNHAVLDIKLLHRTTWKKSFSDSLINHALADTTCISQYMYADRRPNSATKPRPSLCMPMTLQVVHRHEKLAPISGACVRAVNIHTLAKIAEFQTDFDKTSGLSSYLYSRLQLEYSLLISTFHNIGKSSAT